MFSWEIKKIRRNKNSIIVLILMGILFIQVGFIKPMLETQNEYYDEKKEAYIVDHRQGNIIAQEKLNNKVNELKSYANKNHYGLKNDADKKIIKLSQEKLKKDNGQKYEDVTFYQVIEERLTFPLATLLIVAIIVTLSSNIYTDEKLSNVDSIILSSKNKNKVLNSKFLISLITPVIIYGVYILAAFIITYIQYGSPINGDLQAYRIYNIASLVKDINIVQYISLEVGIIMLVFIAISIFCGLFSFITDNSIQSISYSLLFIAIGKILVVLKFIPDKVRMIIQQCSFIDILSKNSFIASANIGDINILSMNIDLSMFCIGVLGVVVIIGIILNFYVFKRILNK